MAFTVFAGPFVRIDWETSWKVQTFERIFAGWVRMVGMLLTKLNKLSMFAGPTERQRVKSVSHVQSITF